MSGRAVQAGAPQGGGNRESYRKRLERAVRAEFTGGVILPAPGDAVLGAAVCAVPGCGRSAARRGWCQAHYRRWNAAGRPAPQQWSAGADPASWGHQALACCRAPGCRFSQHRDRLCYRHSSDWRRDGQPSMDGWLTALPQAEHTGDAVCAVAGCQLLAELGEPGVCRSHRARWRAQGRPELAEFLFACDTYGEPRFDLRGLTAQARLEIGYVLQCRVDQRRARTTPRSIQPLLRYLADARSVSLLDHSAGFHLAQARAGGRGTSTLRAFIGFAMDCLTDLRDGPGGWEVEYQQDVWRLARLGLPVSRRARFDFRGIEPAWLRTLIKRWLRWRISAGLALSQVRKDYTALCRLARLTTGLGPAPIGLDRSALERYLAALAIAVPHPKTRSADISVVAAFLRAIHQQGWESGLPASAIIHHGDHPRQDTDPPARDLPEPVMAQLEDPANLDRLPDPGTRLLIEILIRTGLRIGDACRLNLDCLVRDRQHAAYLHYRNHKMRRDAMVPIDQTLAGAIRTQQQRVRGRYPQGTVLFPRATANPDGQLPMPTATLNFRLQNWLTDCHVTDGLGEPAHVTGHRFRHTYATRLINSEVSQEVVRRLLDHTSHAMTARYARLADKTIREQWERAQKINIHGEPVELPDAGPLSDAAWMRQNLARAKMALPNGYCGLPPQKTCPHANACLTCPLFITTGEFLPEHHRQLSATREIIARAETSGQARLAQMNRTVETNLLTIINTLDADAPACHCAGTCTPSGHTDAC